MSTRLNQVLTFTNVAPGATVSLPHNINVGQVPLRPDLIFRDNGSFEVIVCTTTELTVINAGDNIATLNAWLWHQHTFDREYGADPNVDFERGHLIPQPFIPATGGGIGSIIVEDEGVPLPNSPHGILDFVGGGVQATDAGAGVARVTVPGITFADEGVPLVGAPHSVLDVVGGGAAITDSGGGVATLTVPAPPPPTPLPVIQDEGVVLPGAPHSTYNFAGAGVTATNAGAGVALITIPAGPPGPQGPPGSSGTITWGDGNIGANADTRVLHPSYNELSTASTDAGLDLAVDWVAPRAGTFRNLFARHCAVAGNGNNVVYTFSVNGVAQPLTVTLATGAIGQASNLINSFVVAQGDRVRIRAFKAAAIGGGAVKAICTVEFV